MEGAIIQSLHLISMQQMFMFLRRRHGSLESVCWLYVKMKNNPNANLSQSHWRERENHINSADFNGTANQGAS